ncbi:MAG: helix-turn-helix transcriptional regulator [Clostridiales bacterium]|nr:helix-turn-helix transcriptional regulator [Clostridiales bacterium]
MKFNTRLRKLRLSHKLTQGDLANYLGLKPTAISNYESQRNEPSFEKLIALAEFFDVSCDYLLGVSNSYLPIEGEIIDKDLIELFEMYQQLNIESINELKSFSKYLLYRQELQLQ